MQALHLFLWLCALGAAVVIPLTLLKRKVVCLGWLVVYVLIYSYFSMNGGYVPKTANSTKTIWAAQYCQAEMAGKYPFSLSPAGAFFLPLVCGDRLFVHRSVKVPTSTAALPGAGK